MEGAPVAVDRFVVIPGARDDILVSEFDSSHRHVKQRNMEIGVVVPESITPLAAGDLIRSVELLRKPVRRKIKQAGLHKRRGSLLSNRFRSSLQEATGINAYKLSALFGWQFRKPRR